MNGHAKLLFVRLEKMPPCKKIFARFYLKINRCTKTHHGHRCEMTIQEHKKNPFWPHISEGGKIQWC